jgi:hypothetical protein
MDGANTCGGEVEGGEEPSAVEIEGQSPDGLDRAES